MTGIYYVEAADWLRAVGITVVETDDWQTRARSSGGFAAPPLGIQWHHTAGNMNLDANLSWQTEGSDDAPIGNMTLWDDGVVYMIAAGAANTAGKGGPWTMSRGVVPLDKGNTTTWAIEAANNGVGQPWPQAQIDSYFKISNELNRRFGNLPSDLFSHAAYAPSRKIDPATAAAVQGPWRPASVTSSGTWSVDDIKAEATRRASDNEEDEVTDEDVERIATAVWRRMMTFKPTNKQMSAEDILEWTAQYACNADMQTRD